MKTFGRYIHAATSSGLLTFCAAIRDVYVALSDSRFRKSRLCPQMILNAPRPVATGWHYLVIKISTRNNSVDTLGSGNEKIMQAFGRQAIPMAWDLQSQIHWQAWNGQLCRSNGWDLRRSCGLRRDVGLSAVKVARNGDTAALGTTASIDVVLTDPPYYDNVPYANISDFFYVWLRRTVRASIP